jgi:hypothetical protein
MEELTCYHKLSKEAGWDEEGESTVTKMKTLMIVWGFGRARREV